MSETNKERYEQFFRSVQQQEFFWNIEPDDLEQLALFFKARASFKRQMRDAVMNGKPLDLSKPLYYQTEDGREGLEDMSGGEDAS